MKITAKIATFSNVSHNGYTIPKEVLEKALREAKDNNKPGWVHLGPGQSLMNVAGKLEKIEIEDTGAFATVEVLDTPSGQTLEKIVTEMGSGSIQILPAGYVSTKESGEVEGVTIIGFNVERL